MNPFCDECGDRLRPEWSAPRIGGDRLCDRCLDVHMQNERAIAQAVTLERNMTATWLDKLGDADMWADIATRYHLAAQAIRNGEHVKEEA